MDKSKMRNFKGITLIALVITIIVLLILAGIAISMIAGNNGILTKAVDAKKANEKGIENDKMSLAKQEALVEGYSTSAGMTLADLNTALGRSLTVNQYNGNVKEVVEGVPIPTGFVYVEGTKKDDGLIVVDKYGNEFVWVPIASGAETTDTSVLSEPGVEPNSNNITDNINTEYNAMKTSVATYGGFYVGRYETSWTGTQVASVGNVDPMNGETQVNNADSTWYTFYTESKKLHNDSVVSSMIYNSQWNVIMKWVDDVINTNVGSTTKYIEDSTGMGHYNYDSNGNEISSGSIKTGSNDNYKVKNIYDLAGNMSEWTQKSTYSSTRLLRGGSYSSYGSYSHASYGKFRDPTDNYDFCGSRLTLYIK